MSSPTLLPRASEYPNNYIKIADKKNYIIVFDKDTNSIVKLPNWIITMVEKYISINEWRAEQNLRLNDLMNTKFKWFSNTVQRAVLIHIMRDMHNKGEDTDQLLTGIAAAVESKLMRNKDFSCGAKHKVKIEIERAENAEEMNEVNRISFKLLNNINLKSQVGFL